MAAIEVYTTASGRLDLSSTPLNEVLDAIKDQGLAWIDIRSPDAEVRDFLSNTLAVDELALEDVFGEATTASLKFQDHRFYVVIARHPHERLDTEAVSIFVTEGLMVTVRDSKIPAFRTFARRFATSDPEDLALGVDFLLYELLDAIADDWIPILTQCSSDLDDLEVRVFDPTTEHENPLEGLHELKRKLREANKSIESLNTITMRILQPGERLVSTNVKHYFTDLHQLTTALVKRATNYSAGATSTRDSYLSSISMQLSESNARLTEVMTTLTIIGSIMLPLTLIAGIFGMNNEDLPDEVLGGFWGIVGFMALFATTMLTYFWRKGWIGSARR